MTNHDRQFLELLCDALQDRFPGVTAAFEGFRTRYLGGERDGFIMVEVFGVPAETAEAVLQAGERMVRDHLQKGGSFIALSLWTPEETRENFQRDLESVRRAPPRRWFPVERSQHFSAEATICWCYADRGEGSPANSGSLELLKAA
jgi:hypothetical protein